MSEEFKDFQETPTLTLDPFGTGKEEPALAEEKPAQAPAYDESILSEEERKNGGGFFEADRPA